MKEGVTSPPKPYTEGQFIPMMKTCGKTVENEEEIEILKEIEGLGTEARGLFCLPFFNLTTATSNIFYNYLCGVFASNFIRNSN